ncbi:hypothetical protein CLV63_102279 [Murinocardiopsis flavida]|uniref:Uncharacterized protein n=1 Tax=Murinocardiopsis flavida TaxID=645275 RepID=A0A2P8DSG5_9ACTN|nr:hypothetical protein [Murinocardiopsis flavida]PSL00152.1 hypothetical protein CLV63_102279 [Murinocardiopsis flavida]
MKLRMLGSTSLNGECPTLYETEGGDIVVQGDRLTDPGALGQVAHVLPGEAFVVVPRELLTRFAPKE